VVAEVTFDTIYSRNLWNGEESLSGPGSGTSATRNISGIIADVAKLIDAQTVLDVGCGDGFWMPDLPGYLGIDISKTAIELAQKNHPDRLYRLLPAELPKADLVICRDMLQHLSLDTCQWLIDQMQKAGRVLLLSTYMGLENFDIENGSFAERDLTAPPFSLGEPSRLYLDGWGYRDPFEVRDHRKFLGLWL
jgi:SAM-dependent methyltransferase